MNAGKIYRYRILRREEGHIEVRIELLGDHPVFRGHFPGMPLTPGVCQVDMIGDILSGELGMELMLCTSPAIKFPTMLEPGKYGELLAGIEYSEAGGKLMVRASLADGERTYLKFRGEYVQHV